MNEKIGQLTRITCSTSRLPHSNFKLPIVYMFKVHYIPVIIGPWQFFDDLPSIEEYDFGFVSMVSGGFEAKITDAKFKRAKCQYRIVIVIYQSAIAFYSLSILVGYPECHFTLNSIDQVSAFGEKTDIVFYNFLLRTCIGNFLRIYNGYRFLKKIIRGEIFHPVGIGPEFI